MQARPSRVRDGFGFGEMKALVRAWPLESGGLNHARGVEGGAGRGRHGWRPLASRGTLPRAEGSSSREALGSGPHTLLPSPLASPRSVQTRRVPRMAPYSSPRSHVAEGLARPPRITHPSLRKGQALAGFSRLHRQPRWWPESGAGSADLAPEGAAGAAVRPEPHMLHGPRAAAPGGCPSRHPQKASQHRTPFIIPGPSDLSNQDQLLSAVSKGCQTLRESAGALLWEPQEAMEPQAGVPVARPHLCLGEHVGLGAGQAQGDPLQESVGEEGAGRSGPWRGWAVCPPLAFAP